MKVIPKVLLEKPSEKMCLQVQMNVKENIVVSTLISIEYVEVLTQLSKLDSVNK